MWIKCKDEFRNEGLPVFVKTFTVKKRLIRCELKITALFELSILSDIFDRFGDDIKIVRLDEKTYSVALQVQISKTFFAWVVGTQEKVKIKSPQGVVDEFNAFASKIKEEY